MTNIRYDNSDNDDGDIDEDDGRNEIGWRKC